MLAGGVSAQEPAPAAPGAPAPQVEPPAIHGPDRPADAPRFPGTLSGEVRARYYFIRNLYDLDNKHDDDLNMGTERVGLRAEGQPLDELTLRFGVFQVHSIGFGSEQVFTLPNVVDERERPIELDRAHLEWKPSAVPGLTLTVGRQDMVIGIGFLVGDGVRLEDKSNLLGYLENNRQDFDAVRAEWRKDGWTLNAYGARVSDTESGTSARHLWLTGLDVEKELAGHRPALSLAYGRDLRPLGDLYGSVIGFPFTSPLTPYTADDANAWTLAVSLRSGGPLFGPLGYRAEVVHEIGKSPGGANGNVLARDLVGLRAWGADALLVAFLHPERKDLVRFRYVYLSGDKEGQGNNQFDPMLDSQVFGYMVNAQTNTQALNFGASMTSLEDWQFLVDYWHFRFVEAYNRVLPYGLSRNGHLAAGDEIDAAVVRQWGPHWQTELAGGVFLPGDAWKPDNGNPLGFNTSNDLVWAIRMTLVFQF
jgi:hypothetical protein